MAPHKRAARFDDFCMKSFGDASNVNLFSGSDPEPFQDRQHAVQRISSQAVPTPFGTAPHGSVQIQMRLTQTGLLESSI